MQKRPHLDRLDVGVIDVLVADDQSMVRAGFRMLLSNEEDIEVVAEASDARQSRRRRVTDRR